MNSVHAGFEDVEQYPTIEEKTARLTYALVSNHAFLDGNKRVGMLSMLMALKLNGICLNYTQRELIDLGPVAAVGKAGYQELLAWIICHREDATQM